MIWKKTHNMISKMLSGYIFAFITAKGLSHYFLSAIALFYDYFIDLHVVQKGVHAVSSSICCPTRYSAKVTKGERYIMWLNLRLQGMFLALLAAMEMTVGTVDSP